LGKKKKREKERVKSLLERFSKNRGFLKKNSQEELGKGL
jgi:hypothetical protein